MNKNAFRNQMMFGICDGLSALIIGTTLGYTTTALVSMYKDSDFEITEEQGNWIASIIHGMALLGSLLSNKILISTGSRRSLIIASILSIFAWLIIGCSYNIYQVLLARLFSGFAVGLQQVAVTVYMAETIHPTKRSVFGIIPAITGALGFMVINAIPEYIASWRGTALLGSVLSVPLLVILLYLPESPFHLLKTGNKEEAKKGLIRLRESEIEALKEFEGLGQNETKERFNYVTLFKPPNKWPVTIAILLHLFQPLTGFMALGAFMGLILERSESYFDANATAFITTFVNIATAILTAKLPSMFGRRTLMKWSSQIIIGGHIALCFYLLMKEKGSPFASFFSIIPFLSFLTYGVGFTVGWGPIPWMFVGDGLPLNIRADVTSLLVAVNWGSNFLVSKTFSIGAHYFGYSGLVAFYAVCTVVAMTVMQHHLPETFGFTSEQIDKYYKESYNKKKVE